MALLQLPDGVRVAGNTPIDGDRFVQPDIAGRDALVTNGRAFEGLLVYVEADQELYILKDVGTPTWETVGGGGGGGNFWSADVGTTTLAAGQVSIDATNAATILDILAIDNPLPFLTRVRLNVTGNNSISLLGETDIFGTANTSYVSVTANSVLIGRDSKLISFSNGGMMITDTDLNRGLTYAADYSAQYTDRSLVDKAYVDSAAGGGGNFWASDVDTEIQADINVNTINGADEARIRVSDTSSLIALEGLSSSSVQGGITASSTGLALSGAVDFSGLDSIPWINRGGATTLSSAITIQSQDVTIQNMNNFNLNSIETVTMTDMEDINISSDGFNSLDVTFTSTFSGQFHIIQADFGSFYVEQNSLKRFEANTTLTDIAAPASGDIRFFQNTTQLVNIDETGLNVVGAIPIGTGSAAGKPGSGVEGQIFYDTLLDEFIAYSNGAWSGFFKTAQTTTVTETANFSLAASGSLSITDSRTTTVGIEYAADYSAGFTDRSLVDKAYVDAQTGGGGSPPFTINTQANFVGFQGAIGTDTDVPLFAVRNEVGNNKSAELADIFIGPINAPSSNAFGNIKIGQNVAESLVAAGEFQGGRNIMLGNGIATGWGSVGGNQGTHNFLAGREVADLTNPFSYSFVWGYQAMRNITATPATWESWIAIGTFALAGATLNANEGFHSDVIAIGTDTGSGATIVDGFGTILIGTDSGKNATLIEDFEILIGGAGEGASLGRGNIGIGERAMRNMVGGTAGPSGVGTNQFNVGIGVHALEDGGPSEKGTFVGTEAGRSGVQGTGNSGYGNWALNRVNGSNNTAIGRYAGYMNSNDIVGSGNTFIGSNTGLDVSTVNVSDVMVIANTDGYSSTDGYRPVATSGTVYMASIGDIILTRDWDGTPTSFVFTDQAITMPDNVTTSISLRTRFQTDFSYSYLTVKNPAVNGNDATGYVALGSFEGTVGGNSYLAFDFANETLSNFGGIVLRDGRSTPRGIQYEADYSATFDDRSLVDKAYVDSVATGGGISVDAVWQFSSTTSAGSSSGEFRLNNADPALTTALYISDETKDGVDFSNLLSALRPNDVVYVQNGEDGTEAALYTVVSLVDNTTYYTVNVTHVDNGGASSFTDGKEFGILLGIGTGQINNPTPRTKSVTIESPTASEDLGLFVSEADITITSVTAFCKGTTPSVTFNITHGTNPASPVDVFTTDQVANTTASVQTFNSGFNDATVPSGSAVSLTTSAATGTIDGFTVTINYTID